MHFDIDKHIVYKCIGGSKLYGIDTPDSDIDYRAVCLPPLEINWGIAYQFNSQQEHKEDSDDLEVHSLAKFTNLAMNCNPNIIELLFVPKEKQIILNKCFIPYIENAQLFLTKRAEHAFSGYAFGQLKRIKLHKQHLFNPPDHKPTRQEYNLSEINKEFDSSFINSIFNLSDEQVSKLGFDNEVLKTILNERKYLSAKRNWDHYETWLKNRNSKRAALEAKYGYDCKYAVHLIRLLRMAKEIAETGNLHVDRSGIDAIYLRKVRSGMLSYEDLIDVAENLNLETKEAFEKSSLPSSPDIKKINELYLHACFNYYKDSINLYK